MGIEFRQITFRIGTNKNIRSRFWFMSRLSYETLYNRLYLSCPTCLGCVVFNVSWQNKLEFDTLQLILLIEKSSSGTSEEQRTSEVVEQHLGFQCQLAKTASLMVNNVKSDISRLFFSKESKQLFRKKTKNNILQDSTPKREIRQKNKSYNSSRRKTLPFGRLRFRREKKDV